MRNPFIAMFVTHSARRFRACAARLPVLEAAEAAERHPPWATPDAVLVGVDAGAEVATADALRPSERHDGGGCGWVWVVFGGGVLAVVSDVLMSMKTRCSRFC